MGGSLKQKEMHFMRLFLFLNFLVKVEGDFNIHFNRHSAAVFL